MWNNTMSPSRSLEMRARMKATWQRNFDRDIERLKARLALRERIELDSLLYVELRDRERVRQIIKVMLTWVKESDGYSYVQPNKADKGAALTVWNKKTAK